jgi:hypothetical protein
MKDVKLSAIVALMLLGCATGLLFYKNVRRIETDSSAPLAGKEVFAEQGSNVGESPGILVDMEKTGVPRIEPPATASKTNDYHMVAASAPHQGVEEEKPNALAANAMPDGEDPEVMTDGFFMKNLKMEEKAVQDVKIYITAARADLEAKNVPVGERAVATSLQGDEIIVTFSPKPEERAGDYVVHVDKATGKVIDTKIWR